MVSYKFDSSHGMHVYFRSYFLVRTPRVVILFSLFMILVALFVYLEYMILGVVPELKCRSRQYWW